ncbi:unnamed protein product [Phytophthora lilii]|uniref:Unnamed protein product n=1 Tax=Phytophthora lilii TaxID=2077276 RepID=A0A9W6X3U5_9STRA|nr:unnamed protein product [Phytophthora lilii]
MIDEPPELEVDEEMEEKPLATVTLSKTLDATCDSLEGSARDPRSGSRVRPVEADLMPVSTPAPALRSALKPLVRDVQIACLQAVKDYYIAFADGYPVDGAKEAVALQRDFFINRLDPKALTENQASPKYVVERWRSLSECFTVLGFHQKSVASVEYHHHVGTCAVSSSARYALRITPTTISSVFPHVAAYPHLYQGLVGEVLIVPSQIYFAIEADTGRICRIEERMDFEAGVARIVGSAQELDFVLSQANLVLDGVSCRKKMELSAPT